MAVDMNPFRPTFGTSPPQLVGRDELVEAFRSSLEDGPGAPGRATLYTGPRGSGKTVMLNEAEESARQLGWIVIAENSTPGLIDRLVREHLPRALADHDPDGRPLTFKSVSAPLGMGGVSWDTTDRHPVTPGLRTQLDALTDVLGARETGVLITVDEIHAGVTAELRELTSVIQHGFREERQLAFVAAGLARAVDERLLGDNYITFLRRADRHTIGAVHLDDVASGLHDPIVAAGRDITPQALTAASEATAGYPFLIQLVGFHIWRQSGGHTITLDDVTAALPAARRRLGQLVHEPSLAAMSDVDRTFLLAMAQDDGPSKLSDVAQRLGVPTNYASQYRLRLLAAELIVAPARGYVDFELPYMREYLREHGALQAQTAIHSQPPGPRLEAGDTDRGQDPSL